MEHLAPLRRTREGHVAPVLAITRLVATYATCKLEPTERDVRTYTVAVSQRVIASRHVLKVSRVEAVLLEHFQSTLIRAVWW